MHGPGPKIICSDAHLFFFFFFGCDFFLSPFFFPAFPGLHFPERAVTFEDHAWLTSPKAPEPLNQHVRLQIRSRGGALPPPAVTRPRRGEVPLCSALAFICKACSCKCRVFTNAGIARSLELCPSTKEALKQETRCHGMFQASSTRLNQIIAVSALAASSWKKQQVLSKSYFPF